MTARLATLLFLALAAALCAADALPPLRLRLDAVMPRAETPVAATATLDWRGPGLLEGVLEFRMLFGGNPSSIHRTGEIALAPGQKRMRLLLPPVAGSGGAHETIAAFIGKDGARHELGTHTLGVWLTGEPFVIGVCDGRPRASEGTSEFWRAISLGAYWKGDQPLPHPAVPAWFEPGDAPDSVMHWCAHDLVVVAGAGFRALREKHLTSLAHWAAAGGSVLVLADGRLGQEHLAFLNRLALTYPQRFTLDATGRLIVPDDLPVKLRVDFGRAVVAASGWPTASQLDSREWRRAAGYLWKLHPSAAEPIEKNWNDIPWKGMTGAAHQRGYGRVDSPRDIGVMSDFLPDMPQGVRVGKIALIFVGFLLLVGPLERFVLRRLRKLRWTWVTFPLLCAGSVWLQIRQANEAIGFHDRTSVWEFKDVGSDAQILVETRLNAVFPGTSDTREVQLGRSCYQRTDSLTWEDEETKWIDETSGFLGTNSAVKISRRQWHGYSYRQRLFPGTQDDSGIRWTAFPSLKSGMDIEKWRQLIPQLDPEQRYQWEFYARGEIKDRTSDLMDVLIGGRDMWLIARSPGPFADISKTKIFEEYGPSVWVITATRDEAEGRRVTYRRVFRHIP